MRQLSSRFLLLLSVSLFFTATAFADNYREGLSAAYKKDFDKAARLMRLAADAGNPRAQITLAGFYEIGKGVAEYG